MKFPEMSMFRDKRTISQIHKCKARTRNTNNRNIEMEENENWRSEKSEVNDEDHSH